MLEMLEKNRIVSFTLADDARGVVICEECDRHFSEILSAAQFDEMLAELTSLRRRMK